MSNASLERKPVEGVESSREAERLPRVPFVVTASSPGETRGWTRVHDVLSAASEANRLQRRIVYGLWILTALSVLLWISLDTVGWDTSIYLRAVHSVLAGHDPYADAIAVQQIFHSQLALHPKAQVPCSYVYSPMTLPLLRVFGAVPLWLGGGLYWLIYVAGVLAQIWFGMRAVQPQERFAFQYLAPVAAFFPGFLASGIVLSGNVAYIFFGAALVAAVHGWERGRWRWFYLVVVIASCFKAPFLSLVALPVLSARKQWQSAGITLAIGVVLFAVQPLLWPSLFRHYLQAVELQFSYNRDFGSSPAGLFSGVLFDHHIPYSPLCLVLYAAYAIPLAVFLLHLSHNFLQGSFSLELWIPVLLLGVILLNPRLIEYDLAPLALPLALIAWRFFASLARRPIALAYLVLVFLALNCISVQSWSVWKLTEGPLLVAFFAAGSWTLLHQNARTQPNLLL